jgi:glutaredoxin-like protein
VGRENWIITGCSNWNARFVDTGIPAERSAPDKPAVTPCGYKKRREKVKNLLDEKVRKQVGDVFAGLSQPVQILFFGSQENCDYCSDTRQLLEEVVSLSPSLGLSFYDLLTDAAIAAQYHVDKAPVFVVASKDGETLTDTGIQYAGIPSGHEFTTLIQDIVLVSSRDSGLKPATREFLKGLRKPIHLQVFVTPTCPYCPRAVVLAHQMAMENPGMVRAEGVESMEFQELAGQFNVSGVPQTSINAGAGTVVGAVPEADLLAEIQRIAT